MVVLPRVHFLFVFSFRWIRFVQDLGGWLSDHSGELIEFKCTVNLTVGLVTGHLDNGSPGKGERVAGYNRG